MTTTIRLALGAAAMVLATIPYLAFAQPPPAPAQPQAPPQPMGFFISSVGLGDGANLGGGWPAPTSTARPSPPRQERGIGRGARISVRPPLPGSRP